MTFDLQHYQHKRGIERESLRILHSGRPATSDHPLALGSKLTNSNITVDFSEGLVELITEPFYDISSTFSRLTHILGFCSQNLAKDELLLATSMPLTATEDEIKVAHFGTSNSGKMKEVYRRGLAQRYGKIMQAISGVHYNFSYDVELILAQMHFISRRSITISTSCGSSPTYLEAHPFAQKLQLNKHQSILKHLMMISILLNMPPVYA